MDAMLGELAETIGCKMTTERYKCGRCESILEIRKIKLPVRDKDDLYCPVCGDHIKSWNEAKMWTATVIERAEKHLGK